MFYLFMDFCQNSPWKLWIYNGILFGGFTRLTPWERNRRACAMADGAGRCVVVTLGQRLPLSLLTDAPPTPPLHSPRFKLRRL